MPVAPIRNGVVAYLRQRAKAIVLLVLVLIIWEAAVRLFSIPKFLLPAPTDIVLKMADLPGFLWHHSLVTIRETLVGFVLGMVVGIALAVLIVHSRLVEEALYPILIFMQTTPKMAIAPLLIVWMGFGDPPKVAIVFLISFFPMVVDTATGLRSVEPELLEMLHGLRASPWKVLTKARFPCAIPHIFSAMRITITLSITGAVVAEFVGASEGLGHVIIISGANMQTDLTFAAILMLGIIGVILFSLVGLAERIVAPWQTGTDHHVATA